MCRKTPLAPESTFTKPSLELPRKHPVREKKRRMTKDSTRSHFRLSPPPSVQQTQNSNEPYLIPLYYRPSTNLCERHF